MSKTIKLLLTENVDSLGIVGDVVEETLRYEPPALSCSRYAPAALELGGVVKEITTDPLLVVRGKVRPIAILAEEVSIQRFDARDPVEVTPAVAIEDRHPH